MSLGCCVTILATTVQLVVGENLSSGSTLSLPCAPCSSPVPLAPLPLALFAVPRALHYDHCPVPHLPPFCQTALPLLFCGLHRSGKQALIAALDGSCAAAFGYFGLRGDLEHSQYVDPSPCIMLFSPMPVSPHFPLPCPKLVALPYDHCPLPHFTS